MKKISGGHHGVKVSERDRRMITQWLDASAPYAGTYAALGSGFLDGQSTYRQLNPTAKRPAVAAARQAAARRCVACHLTPLPFDQSRPIAHPDPKDKRNVRLRAFTRHILFNLTHPEKSLYLKAPLAKKAGGLELCVNADGSPVFASAEDPDYKAILAGIRDGKTVLDAVKRFDMPGFRPNVDYLREMKRYGILPPDYDVKKGPPVDPYALDRRYWALDWPQLK